MGFGAVAATLVSILLIMTALYISIESINLMTDTVAFSFKNMEDSAEERVNTGIDIGTITAADPFLYVDVTNTGDTRIKRFSKMDIIVTNTTIGSTYWLEYTSTGFGWSQVIYSPDTINPGLLDPGETMKITIDMVGREFPDWIKIITPNGVSSSAYV